MTEREEIKHLVRQALSQMLVDDTAEESSVPGPAAYFAPWTGVEYESHPSRRLFSVLEASMPVSNLVEFVESKLCTIENNRPCDQCGICRSLGF